MVDNKYRVVVIAGQGGLGARLRAGDVRRERDVTIKGVRGEGGAR